MNMHPFKVLRGNKTTHIPLHMNTAQSAQVGHSSSVPVKIVTIVLVTSECYPGYSHVMGHPPLSVTKLCHFALTLSDENQSSFWNL